MKWKASYLHERSPQMIAKEWSHSPGQQIVSMFLGFGTSGLIGTCLFTFFSPVVIAYYRLGNLYSLLAHDSGGCEVPGHGANIWHVVSSQGTV